MADKQPEALVLINEYRPSMPPDLFHSWASDVNAELARQHALIAELVGALEGIGEAVESMQNTFGKLWGATPEDDDTYIHEKWAEDFLKERLAPVVVALAKAKEQQ